MQQKPEIHKNSTHNLFWGSSIALSWTWGLGLFFSVQMAYLFGWKGLLFFAASNAVGLFLFGLLSNRFFDKQTQNADGESYFFQKAKRFNAVFLWYQWLTVMLTLFAIIRYVFQHLYSGSASGLILIVTLLLFVAVTLIWSESMTIKKIKFAHAILFAVLIIAVSFIFLDKQIINAISFEASSKTFSSIGLGGYVIPIFVGFLFGPWLDLQQWQRVIQIRKEGKSIVASYFFGSILFFSVLCFHGILTIWAIGQSADLLAYKGIEGAMYGHDIIFKLFSSQSGIFSFLWIAYLVFIVVCIITTLDSAYIAIRWFNSKHTVKSDNILHSILPMDTFTKPAFYLVSATVAALVLHYFNFELEYYMVFYASFFIVYGLIFIPSFVNNTENTYLRNRVFGVSIISLSLCALGYLLGSGALMSLGCIAAFLVLLVPSAETAKLLPEEKEAVPTDLKPSHFATAEVLTTAAQPMASEYIEDQWYVYSFRATYCDTNSVGNVYFGTYAMWVGKTRELFFNYCLPDFDLDTTHFYILTRSFEHKFIKESKEFDAIKVKIKVKDFNRRFATLEHEIVGQDNQVLGRGKQTLLFVKVSDYSAIDIQRKSSKALCRFLQIDFLGIFTTIPHSILYKTALKTRA